MRESAMYAWLCAHLPLRSARVVYGLWMVLALLAVAFLLDRPSSAFFYLR